MGNQNQFTFPLNSYAAQVTKIVENIIYYEDEYTDIK